MTLFLLIGFFGPRGQSHKVFAERLFEALRQSQKLFAERSFKPCVSQAAHFPTQRKCWIRYSLSWVPQAWKVCCENITFPTIHLGLVILNILFFSKCLRCYCHALSPLCTWRACRPTSQDCCWMPQEPIKDILVKHVIAFIVCGKFHLPFFPRKHVIAPSTRFTSKERPLTLVAWLCRHDRNNIWYSLKRRTKIIFCSDWPWPL